MIDVKTSYTSADSIPLKMLLDQDVVQATKKGFIPPVHIQFSPTNKCNMSCFFCAYDGRDKNLELSLEECEYIIDTCSNLGTKACTLTGGGSPMMHPNIADIINYLDFKNIKIGLVTNGLLLSSQQEALSNLTWCRISNGDSRIFGGNYKKHLLETVKTHSSVDWAFSHVCSASPNLDEISRVVEFANENNFTHVRVVSDIFHPEIIDMDVIKNHLILNGINTEKVIFQGRKSYEAGGPCYICYLKPFINADGNLITCCGSNYALDDGNLKTPKELYFGNVADIESIIMNNSNKPFDGSICKKCYYMNYNRLLENMLKDIKHKEFV